MIDLAHFFMLRNLLLVNVGTHAFQEFLEIGIIFIWANIIFGFSDLS